MTKIIKTKGFAVGSNPGLITLAVDAASDSATVSSALKPAFITSLPRLSDTFDGDTMTVDLGGLTGVTNYDFREVGGSSLQTGASATFDTTGHGGKWVEVRVTADPSNTVYTSPPVMVNAMMAGMAASMVLDDRAILAILPHEEITHLAIAGGDWTDSAIWLDARVPRYGANVLIPRGRTVTYDVSEQNIRLDRVRIDGRLDFARDQDTKMLVETMVVTRGATLTIGESNATRLPVEYSCEIVISGKSYRSDSYVPTDMDAATVVAKRSWERGIVALGTWRMWGAKKTVWGWATEGLQAGATELTFDRDMEGLSVGDTIIIGPTDFAFDYSQFTERGPTLHTEERVITEINGRTVEWATPLVHDHDNHLSTSTREDIVPPVMVKNNKNIVIRSEVSDVEWRRGHTAGMHHHAQLDFWDAAFIELGRTSKDTYWDGIINSDGDWVTKKLGNTTVALTPQSNVQGRYPVHGHLLGFARPEDKRSVITSCYVEGTPGVAMVHHDCDMDLFNNGMYKFFGTGMFSEQGSEIGAWVNNLAMHTTYVGRLNPFYPENPIVNPLSGPKTMEAAAGSQGFGARRGYGFYYRGRGLRGNGNVACGVVYGHVFYPRVVSGTYPTKTSGNVVSVKNLPRAALDISEAGVLRQTEVGITDDEFVHVDYPILHMADNYTVAALGGTFVTKQKVSQEHDVNVKIKRPKSYGMLKFGVEIEYISVYIVDRADATMLNSSDNYGNGTGAQALMVAFIHPRADTYNAPGVRLNVNVVIPTAHEAFDNVEDPRFALIGDDYVGGGNRRGFLGEAPYTKKGVDVTLDDRDWDGELLDYELTPSDNVPLVIGEINSTFAAVRDMPDSETYFKTDNLSDRGRIIPKRTNDMAFPDERNDVRTLRSTWGYWEYDNGSGTEQFVRIPYLMSDRLTGRPAKDVKLIKLGTGEVSGTNNGAFVRAATPISAPDLIKKTAAKNGSVSFNVLTDCAPTGAGGSGTYTIETGKGNGDFLGADYGRLALSANGDATYTPDPDYEGTDEAYLFIYSQNRWHTVRYDFLIGSTGTGIEVPVSGTHFTATGGVGKITFDTRLSTGHSSPDADKRRIDEVQYSTDGGTTWRRLANGNGKWIPETREVTDASDGTALSAGSYNVQVRYITSHGSRADRTSGASASASVTVT